MYSKSGLFCLPASVSFRNRFASGAASLISDSLDGEGEARRFLVSIDLGDS